MPKIKANNPPSVELCDNKGSDFLEGFDLSKLIVLVLLVLILLLGYFMFKLYQKMTKSSEEVVLLKQVIGKQSEMLSGITNMAFTPPHPVEEPEKEQVETQTETKEVPRDNTLEPVIEEVAEEEKSDLNEIDEVNN